MLIQSLILIGALMLVGVLSTCFAASQPTTTRSGVVAMRGKGLTLVGAGVKAGDAAPAFNAVAADLSTFAFKPGEKVWIIAAVPSLDTPVCSIEAKRFNEEAAKLTGVGILTISMDLPFAQKRWCAAEGVKNLTVVSDYRDREFGPAYGVHIKENGLLARAVFVVGKDGRLSYVQVVPELTQEPDYAAALAAAANAAK